MRRVIFITFLALSAYCSAFAFADQFNLQRGYENYARLLNGQLQLQSLSDVERQEVMFVIRMFQSSAPADSSSECKEAYDDANNASDELSSTAQRLKNCAESKQFESDDCSSEMRRVRSAHSDYESAVSEVQSECN